jgi:hypothetical protein
MLDQIAFAPGDGRMLVERTSIVEITTDWRAKIERENAAFRLIDHPYVFPKPEHARSIEVAASVGIQQSIPVRHRLKGPQNNLGLPTPIPISACIES